MAVGKKDTDIEWPTFDNGDIQVSYSPGENEKIFADFKPATEFHNIRNKKRKPKKKPRELRLISGKSQGSYNKNFDKDHL